jgi:membrane protein
LHKALIKYKAIVNRTIRLLTIYVKLAIRKAKLVSFIGFDSAPIYDVVTFFVRGILRGSISTRASAIAFDFFIALFPTIIFVFTLIPYIPVQNFQGQLLELIEGILPYTVFQLIEITLVDVVTQKSFGLLSFGFLTAVFFAHNGMSSLIDAFNATYHTVETRKFVNQHAIALLLTIILPSLLTLMVLLLLFGQFGLNYLVDSGIFKLNFTYYLIVILRWIVIVCVLFFSISFLYYLAPARRTKLKFISAGSIMATVMILITSIGFSFFVNNFGQYNKLYGSIGSILALMIWIYFNAIGLIIGFEINASIKSAKDDFRKSIISLQDEHKQNFTDQK